MPIPKGEKIKPKAISPMWKDSVVAPKAKEILGWLKKYSKR